MAGAGEVRYQCGSVSYGGWSRQHPVCEVSVLRKRVDGLECEVADYMKLFCDWKAYATNLESVGKQMLDGGFHAPHIIIQWREAENTRP